MSNINDTDKGIDTGNLDDASLDDASLDDASLDGTSLDDTSTVLATFTRRRQAHQAAAILQRELGSDADIQVGEQEDVVDALVINQRAEMDDSILAPGAGFFSGPMVRGGLFWGILGLVVGAAIALGVLVFVDWPSENRLLFVVGIAAAGALGLASATVLIGAVRRAQREGEFTPENPWAVVRVDVAGDREQEVLDRLAEQRARSIRLVTSPVVRHGGEDLETPRDPEAHPGARGAPSGEWPAGQFGADSKAG